MYLGITLSKDCNSITYIPKRIAKAVSRLDKVWYSHNHRFITKYNLKMWLEGPILLCGYEALLADTGMVIQVIEAFENVPKEAASGFGIVTTLVGTKNSYLQ